MISFALTGTDEGWGTGGVNVNSVSGMPDSGMVLHYTDSAWTEYGWRAAVLMAGSCETASGELHPSPHSLSFFCGSAVPLSALFSAFSATSAFAVFVQAGGHAACDGCRMRATLTQWTRERTPHPPM